MEDASVLVNTAVSTTGSFLQTGVSFMPLILGSLIVLFALSLLIRGILKGVSISLR